MYLLLVLGKLTGYNSTQLKKNKHTKKTKFWAEDQTNKSRAQADPKTKTLLQTTQGNETQDQRHVEHDKLATKEGNTQIYTVYTQGEGG